MVLPDDDDGESVTWKVKPVQAVTQGFLPLDPQGLHPDV